MKNAALSEIIRFMVGHSGGRRLVFVFLFIYFFPLCSPPNTNGVFYIYYTL